MAVSSLIALKKSLEEIRRHLLTKRNVDEKIPAGNCLQHLLVLVIHSWVLGLFFFCETEVLLCESERSFTSRALRGSAATFSSWSVCFLLAFFCCLTQQLRNDAAC